jgi:hypothetical protein
LRRQAVRRDECIDAFRIGFEGVHRCSRETLRGPEGTALVDQIQRARSGAAQPEGTQLDIAWERRLSEQLGERAARLPP